MIKPCFKIKILNQVNAGILNNMFNFIKDQINLILKQHGEMDDSELKIGYIMRQLDGYNTNGNAVILRCFGQIILTTY